ncbi:MAG: AI-2E family transporter [Phycisphaerales bacterium]|nr:AI-2E family transporter [Phycisphaerales bacterium]
MTASPDDAAAREATGRARSQLFLAVALIALSLLAWRLSDVLVLMFGAIIVAVALQAVAAPLERRLGMSERVSVAVAVLLTLVATVVGAWLIGDRLVEQTAELRQRIPRALEALVGWARGHPIGVALLEVWDSSTAEDVNWAGVARIATGTLGAVGSLGLLLVIGVYLAANPRLYRVGLVRLVPPAHRSRIDEALVASGHALRRWLLGQGVSMLFVGASTAIGLALLGVPLAATVGVIAGVITFVPFFGPIASGILAVLLAFTQGPEQALYVAILCVAIQQAEGTVLMPFVQRWAVELPPVLGITSAVIFGLLFGLPGVVLATPLMVVVMVLVEKLYVEGVLEGKPAPV